MPDYMRPQKEHDALGGVYDFLEEAMGGSPDTREEAIRTIAEEDVAHDYEEESKEWSRWAYEEKEREVAEEIGRTYPVEEHEYHFVFDPPGKRPTDWQIYTEKRPDGSWSGSIQRATTRQVAVDAFDTSLHEKFVQEHSASERALLDDLIHQVQRWTRTRRNPRQAKKARKKTSALFRRLMRI